MRRFVAEAQLCRNFGSAMEEYFTQVHENKKQYIDLLLLGDEQESMIDRYLERGDMYVLADAAGGIVKAVAVVTEEGPGVCELKNIAVAADARRRGLGRRMLGYLLSRYSGRCARMLVGTGDVPSTVGFYRACGFVPSHRIRDFFTDNYDHPIVEDGILLRDMLYLSLDLTAAGPDGHAAFSEDGGPAGPA